MRKLFWKVIFASAFLAVAVLFGPSSALAESVSLSLNPSSGTVASGAEFNVAVILNTAGKEVDGVDLNSLTYPVKNLQVQDITGGGILDVTVVKKTEGQIKLVGTVKPGAPGYKGTGTVATIKFKALADTSKADVRFDYTAGSTTDCNVAEHGTAKDILASVQGASFELGGSQSNIQTPPPATGSGSTNNSGSTQSGTPSGSQSAVTAGASPAAGSAASVNTATNTKSQTKIGGYLAKNNLEWLPYLGIGILISIILVVVLRQFAKRNNP